jgi:hypothetical protein
VNIAAQPPAAGLSWRRVLHQLRDPAVRDLGFLLLSPSLLQRGHAAWGDAVADWNEEEWWSWRRWLFTQDIAPQRLKAHLAADPANRLGRYAEQLLGFALMHAPPELGMRLLSSNHVVAQARATLGELDFVLERKGVVEHWELAVKFYRHDPRIAAPDPLHQFVGADGRDSLGDKLHTMFARQLPLQASDLPSADRALAYLRGWLFYTAAGVHGLRTDAIGLAAHHPRGSWIEQGDEGLFKQGSWVLLPRLAWLPPARIVRNEDGDYPRIGTQAGGRAELWAQVAKRSDGSREEVQRVLVLPRLAGDEDAPRRAGASA